jgi:hypothetical protein
MTFVGPYTGPALAGARPQNVGAVAFGQADAIVRRGRDDPRPPLNGHTWRDGGALACLLELLEQGYLAIEGMLGSRMSQRSAVSSLIAAFGSLKNRKTSWSNFASSAAEVILILVQADVIARRPFLDAVRTPADWRARRDVRLRQVLWFERTKRASAQAPRSS